MTQTELPALTKTLAEAYDHLLRDHRADGRLANAVQAAFFLLTDRKDERVVSLFDLSGLAREAVEVPQWRDIETVPHDTPVILANFAARCLLSGAPHVWTARYATRFEDGDGNEVQEQPRWLECSYAATNDNGEPTHWMPLPASPTKGQL